MHQFLHRALGALKRNRKRALAVAVMAVCCSTTVYGVSASTKTVYIQDGEKTKIIETMKSSPAQILEQADFATGPNSDIRFTGFSGGYGSITVQTTLRVSVTADGQTEYLTLPGGTVSDALGAAGVMLGADDLVNFPPTTALIDNMSLQVDRVHYSYLTATQSTVGPLGSPLDPGATYLQKAVNGKVVSCVLVIAGNNLSAAAASSSSAVSAPSSQVSSAPAASSEPAAPSKPAASSKPAAPKPKTTPKTTPKKTSSTPATPGNFYNPAIAVSKLVPSVPFQLDSRNRPLRYSKIITGRATAYSARKGAHTSTGATVRTGYVAVNPKQIPYGTRMYIITTDGAIIYGYAMAEDTGGFAKVGKTTVDLFYNTESECIRFGARQVNIYILS